MSKYNKILTESRRYVKKEAKREHAEKSQERKAYYEECRRKIIE